MGKKWYTEEIQELFDKPLLELIFEAQITHRKHFNPREIQMSTLLSVKTGGCPEDCKYCSQSARYKTGLQNEKLMEVENVLETARKAKESGSTRFCMGAAWSNPHDRDMPYLVKMVEGVKALGMETCMTLGKLTKEQILSLADAGLDYYSHNLDTSPEFYGSIITTRSYQDRLDTIARVRETGIKVCSGGIIGLGEKHNDRVSLLLQLANLSPSPESVPINMLVKVKGTPLENNDTVEPFDYIRIIAISRILMPTSYIRIAAGREKMSEQTQAMCFMAGANSIFYGCKLLTASNPDHDADSALIEKLGLIKQEIYNQLDDNSENNKLRSRVDDALNSELYYNAAE
ncbi:biotin synthase (plasmid) [Klebsiella oxytoca]|uniref:biotin synthase BioB n=1 Tax=Klebsiella oxytoca TaxID=571 RepID=UPI000D52A694|nr:biotin synthase BioB [Klebsiella oxytoca]AWF33390.1 biotin synthase [Klebsiella oxytoca]